MAIEARFDDFLDFPFWFAINNIGWWSLVIWAVSLSFVVLSQEVHVEDGVDLH